MLPHFSFWRLILQPNCTPLEQPISSNQAISHFLSLKTTNQPDLSFFKFKIKMQFLARYQEIFLSKDSSYHSGPTHQMSSIERTQAIVLTCSLYLICLTKREHFLSPLPSSTSGSASMAELSSRENSPVKQIRKYYTYSSKLLLH